MNNFVMMKNNIQTSFYGQQCSILSLTFSFFHFLFTIFNFLFYFPYLVYTNIHGDNNKIIRRKLAAMQLKNVCIFVFINPQYLHLAKE